MAFDLVVGKSNKVKDAPDIVGELDFHELPAFSRLILRVDSFFLHRISNIFEDQSFSLAEIEQALAHLMPLLPLRQLDQDERGLLHKLIAVLSYAKWKQQPLYGVAD